MLVNQDKKLIDQLCKVGFENYWSISNSFAPAKAPEEVTDEEVTKHVERYGNYKARMLSFTAEPWAESIEFLRLQQISCSRQEKIYDGSDERDLQLAIQWIKSKRPKP
ncbi:MAG TPA: hypothetical protein PKI61_01255 [bacterium]|nr:hypothetical protein [bacterium]